MDNLYRNSLLEDAPIFYPGRILRTVIFDSAQYHHIPDKSLTSDRRTPDNIWSYHRVPTPDDMELRIYRPIQYFRVSGLP